MPPAMRSENSAVKNRTRMAATRKNRLKNSARASSTNAPLKAEPNVLQKLLPLKPASNKPPNATAAKYARNFLRSGGIQKSASNSTVPSASTQTSRAIREEFISFGPQGF